MKIDFKNKNVLWASIILGVAFLLFVGFKIGQRNALEVELASIDEQIAETSSRINPSEHLRLLAKRKAIQNLISKL